METNSQKAVLTEKIRATDKLCDKAESGDIQDPNDREPTPDERAVFRTAMCTVMTSIGDAHQYRIGANIEEFTGPLVGAIHMIPRAVRRRLAQEFVARFR